MQEITVSNATFFSFRQSLCNFGAGTSLSQTEFKLIYATPIIHIQYLQIANAMRNLEKDYHSIGNRLRCICILVRIFETENGMWDVRCEMSLQSLS